VDESTEPPIVVLPKPEITPPPLSSAMAEMFEAASIINNVTRAADRRVFVMGIVFILVGLLF